MNDEQRFETTWSDVDVTVLARDQALVSLVFRDALTGGDGVTTRLRGPTTFVWSRRDGDWRIIYADADQLPRPPLAPLWFIAQSSFTLASGAIMALLRLFVGAKFSQPGSAPVAVQPVREFHETKGETKILRVKRFSWRWSRHICDRAELSYSHY